MYVVWKGRSLFHHMHQEPTADASWASSFGWVSPRAPKILMWDNPHVSSQLAAVDDIDPASAYSTHHRMLNNIQPGLENDCRQKHGHRLSYRLFSFFLLYPHGPAGSTYTELIYCVGQWRWEDGQPDWYQSNSGIPKGLCLVVLHL